MEKLLFEHIEYLYALFSIPLLVGIIIVALHFKKRAMKRFGDYNILVPLMPDVSFSRPIVKNILLLLSLALIIIAAAGLKSGSRLKEVKREGAEIVIALDVSNSMLAEDIKPNRLTRARRAIKKLTERLVNDKIGIIAFAGEAYMQVPITIDYDATKLFINSMHPDIVSKQGTNIGAAIELAMRSFSPVTDKNKILIIITDGENHENKENTTEMVRQAAEKGITIHCIGMGSTKGAPIPLGGYNNFRKNKDNEIIVSRLDENTLKQISAEGNGIYIRATNSQLGLETLFDEIDKMRKEETEVKVFSEYENQFQYFVAIALLLLIIEFSIMNRKNKFFKGITLFK